MYRYASDNKYGMTICAPLMDQQNQFIGAFCSDILPTMNNGNIQEGNSDNYIQNMYLSFLT